MKLSYLLLFSLLFATPMLPAQEHRGSSAIRTIKGLFILTIVTGTTVAATTTVAYVNGDAEQKARIEKMVASARRRLSTATDLTCRGIGFMVSATINLLSPSTPATERHEETPEPTTPVVQVAKVLSVASVSKATTETPVVQVAEVVHAPPTIIDLETLKLVINSSIEDLVLITEEVLGTLAEYRETDSAPTREIDAFTEALEATKAHGANRLQTIQFQTKARELLRKLP
ncbi:hypothetical protein HN446_00930 [bacterium]|jgi:hypothetical protein|nr:hypothetical protein [bacterium]